MTRAKRALDVAGAALGALGALPLCAIIAWRIHREDGGPTLFSQTRVGRDGRPFRLWKFRTMAVNTEGAGPPITAAGDPRITRVGRWLRRTRLDELPQLFNVLAGDMSLVGPRPEVAQFVDRYSPAERAVLALTPGLTDPATLAALDEEAWLATHADPVEAYVREVMPEKIARNLAYAARASLLSDVGVLLATGRALLRRVVAGRALPPAPPAGPLAADARGSSRLLRHRRELIVGVYAVVVPAGYAAAFLLRYDFALPTGALRALRDTIALVWAIRLAVYWRAGLFRGYWQHFGLYDVVSVVRAATISGVLAGAAVFALAGVRGIAIPPSVLVIDWVLAIFLAGGVHAVSRLAREGGLPSRARAAGRRTLILGAGEAAERVLRQFRHDRKLGIRAVGLVDDDRAKHALTLHGARVLGTTDDLADLVARHSVELLVLAMPSANAEQLRRAVQRCAATGVEFRVVRPLQEVVEGRAGHAPLRSVEVEDLLGRPPVRLDLAAVAAEVAGQVVLVTGGAGSIGRELARQCARLGPSRLVLLDHAETPLVYTQLDLARDFPALDIVAVAGCVTDQPLLDRLCAEHAPRVVFHAAAYKHVPIMEENVLAAVRVNVFGTLAVARAAVRHRAAVVVLLSTDKAVHPSSVMGATKRAAERLILELPELRGAGDGTGPDFRAVRFGNVLGSDGSVVPLFRRQLAAGGPLTVTHPDVERYFMTVQEAVQLVLQSLTLPEGAGRIAMLEMGEPVRIVELAENLIRLSGREPYGDTPIVFTGLRPGEKLRETLVSAFEHGTPTTVEKIRVISSRRSPTASPLADGLAALRAALDAGDANGVLAQLGVLVPESAPPLRARFAAACVALSSAPALALGIPPTAPRRDPGGVGPPSPSRTSSYVSLLASPGT